MSLAINHRDRRRIDVLPTRMVIPSSNTTVDDVDARLKGNSDTR
jgi:hypothetical protein